MKLCGKLNPGETGKLEVTFSPTSCDFTELEQNVETSLHLEVFIYIHQILKLYYWLSRFRVSLLPDCN